MNGLLISRGTFCVMLILAALCDAGAARTIGVDSDGAAEFQTIQAAVNAAETGDTIVVAPGTYTGSGNCDIWIEEKAVTIRSSDPNDPDIVATTVIDCQGTADNRCRAFEIADDGQSGLTLSGLTVVGGYHVHSGGAILCQGAGLNVTHCTFADNTAPWWGGAIHAVNSAMTLRDCTFVRNASEMHYGGAVFFQACVSELINCQFQANMGSAIRSSNSPLTLTGCAFEGNAGNDGGAIHSYADIDAPVPLEMTDCLFSENVASASGGAVHARSIQGTVSACTFTANSAGADGGALYHHRASPVITNSMFVANAAAGMGGAVMSWYESRPDIIHCTFVANDAASGGAVASMRQSHPLISHSILWDNTAGNGGSLFLGRYEWSAVYATQATVEYSDIQGGQSGVRVEPEGRLVWGTGNIQADPLFTGPTQDNYRLSPDSPCINAGDPNVAIEPEATDLDGQPRRFGSGIDMGAYEFQGLGPVYRFWSPTESKHFYTLSGTERDKLINEYAHVWEYEDVAYYAFYAPIAENLLPVHRFWSDQLEAHFWTISEAERKKLVKEFPDVWRYEGVVFYAHPARRQPLGTMPVHRFWSSKLGHHFYTMNEAEKDKLIANYAKAWTYEGIAWYAYARPYQPKKAQYQFAGGAKEAWYTLTLSASVDGQEADIDVPDVELTPAATEALMTIDFANLTTTLDELHVRTGLIEHASVVKQRGLGAVEIPFLFSARASFDTQSPRGPFGIDPNTGTFADFTQGHQNLVGRNSSFTYSGAVAIAGRAKSFDRRTNVTRFELEAAGHFESLLLLPEGLYARMPFTFQWHRQYVKDLLVEMMVDDHLVQVYAIYTHVTTQGLWQGQLVE